MDGYSANAKHEIIKLSAQLPCCNAAFLSALIHTSGSLTFSSDGMKISFNSLLSEVADKLTTIVSGITSGIAVKRYASTVSLSGQSLFAALFDLGIFEKVGEGTAVVSGVKPFIVSSDCCKVNYLRGAFIGCGSVSVKKGYHLELTLSNDTLASDITALLAHFNIPAKHVPRKEKTMLYVKGVQPVADVLALLGASTAVTEIFNEYALRELRGIANRAANCEMGNIGKTVTASMRIIDDINYVDGKIGLTSLSDKLIAAATLRKDNPDDSLSQLADKSGISKSTLKNRLAKLSDIARQLREEEGE